MPLRPMPLRKAPPAASGRSMLRNEYGMPTSRSLCSIVQRLRWYKSLNNKILRMLQNDGQRFFLEIAFFSSSQVKLTAALRAFQREKQGVRIAQKRLLIAECQACFGSNRGPRQFATVTERCVGYVGAARATRAAPSWFTVTTFVTTSRNIPRPAS